MVMWDRKRLCMPLCLFSLVMLHCVRGIGIERLQMYLMKLRIWGIWMDRFLEW